VNFELATVPRDVRRSGWRVLAWGLAALLLVAAGGLLGERIRYGDDMSAARDHIAADAQRQFSSLAARLGAVVEQVRADPLLPITVASRDTAAIRELFGRLATVETGLGLSGDALTVYTPQGRPVAWSGRPGQFPPSVCRVLTRSFSSPAPPGSG
jgi:hypothetical protein